MQSVIDDLKHTPKDGGVNQATVKKVCAMYRAGKSTQEIKESLSRTNRVCITDKDRDWETG